MTFHASLSLSLALPLTLLLTACGGDSSSDTQNTVSDTCVAGETSVQWEKLLSENAANLSGYQLFSNPCNATADPSPRGIPYTLSTPLFTDYASKYRFVFVPQDTVATYSEDDSFDFPVGTVITKTFSLPDNTAERGFDNERQIETRLLVHSGMCGRNGRARSRNDDLPRINRWHHRQRRDWDLRDHQRGQRAPCQEHGYRVGAKGYPFQRHRTGFDQD